MKPALPYNKTRQRDYKKKKLHTNISHEKRCKSPQQNISKFNPTMCIKNHILQTCRIFSRFARVIHHSKNQVCDSYVCVLTCVQLFVTLWTIACQATLSMGFSRPEHRSGLPFPPPRYLSDPGIKPGSPALQTD